MLVLLNGGAVAIEEEMVAAKARAPLAVVEAFYVSTAPYSLLTLWRGVYRPVDSARYSLLLLLPDFGYATHT